MLFFAAHALTKEAKMPISSAIFLVAGSINVGLIFIL